MLRVAVLPSGSRAHAASPYVSIRGFNRGHPRSRHRACSCLWTRLPACHGGSVMSARLGPARRVGWPLLRCGVSSFPCISRALAPRHNCPEAPRSVASRFVLDDVHGSASSAVTGIPIGAALAGRVRAPALFRPTRRAVRARSAPAGSPCLARGVRRLPDSAATGAVLVVSITRPPIDSAIPQLPAHRQRPHSSLAIPPPPHGVSSTRSYNHNSSHHSSSSLLVPRLRWFPVGSLSSL